MESEKICGNCKFWGNLQKEIEKIEKSNYLNERSKLISQKIKIENFNLDTTKECQKISNAETVPLTFFNDTTTVFKKTDKEWSCQLWCKKESELIVLKKFFKNWLAGKYPKLKIVKYPDYAVYKPDKELMEYSIFKPSTWKNKSYIKAIKYLERKEENILWNSKPIDESQFEVWLKECETSKH